MDRLPRKELLAHREKIEEELTALRDQAAQELEAF
jgi:hypothetical protein